MATSTIPNNINVYKGYTLSSTENVSVPMGTGVCGAFYIGAYRTTNSNTRSGWALIVRDSSNVAVFQKQGLSSSLTNISYADENLTVNVDNYTNWLIITF